VAAAVRVRRAERGDIDRVVPLFGAYREFYRQAPDPERERTFLTERMEWGECAIFVAEADGELIGFTLLYPLFTSITLGPAWVLNDLYVSPDHRRTGVGRMLLERAREFGRETSAHSLTLETAKDNPAQRLYESLGWKKDERFLHYELPL
jgi:ribosomal protein S18 acetylase RimI-like enzyme